MTHECTQRPTVEFCLPVRPIPQARHRHLRSGGSSYDPCAKQKQDFLQLALQACAPPPLEARAAPFRCVMKFCFERPKSHKRKRGGLRKGVRAQPTGRPDVDNLVKFVLDALNNVYFVDDSQCIEIIASKAYDDEQSSVAVKIVYGNGAANPLTMSNNG